MLRLSAAATDQPTVASFQGVLLLYSPTFSEPFDLCVCSFSPHFTSLLFVPLLSIWILGQSLARVPKCSTYIAYSKGRGTHWSWSIIRSHSFISRFQGYFTGTLCGIPLPPTLPPNWISAKQICKFNIQKFFCSTNTLYKDEIYEIIDLQLILLNMEWYCRM